jgi:uncharacterized protein (TIGR02302 family)
LLDKLAARATLALSWEAIWPIAVGLLAILGVFLTVSWLGLWIHLPKAARIAGLLIFALLAVAALYPLIRFRLPRRQTALARIDRDSGLPHSPATTLDDILANGQAEPATRALWAAHLKRAEQNTAALKVGLPSPGVPLLDRYSVRAGVLLAAIGAAFIAGPEKYARVLAAFDWQTSGSVTQGFRLDAWIDPPPYTGRPPILLKAQTDGAQDTLGVQQIRAPFGSTIMVRSSEGAGVTAEVTGALEIPKTEKPAEADAAQKPVPPARTAQREGAAADQEKKFSLRGDGKLTLKRLGRTVATYEFTSIPDQPPKISLVGEPRNNVRGSLTIKYKLEDDYGVLSADAEFSKPVVRGKPVTGRTLVGPPKMNLGVAQGPGGLGEAETTTDLSEHPWAGTRATIQLVARDEGGNTGRSEPKEIHLPQKVFVKPLARALVEQRRNLVLAPEDRSRVLLAFEAFMIEPQEFKTSAAIYLGLRTIANRLVAADRLEEKKIDDELRAVSDLIWEMALRIEEGDLSEAERELRAAQQALREALNRGASEEEIKQLMDQLRAAMDRFLREFAEQQRNNPGDDQSQDRNDRDQMITQQDLQRMLDQMERMAREGNQADAQRMLDQLQRMMENLRSARRGNQQNQSQREMNRALNQLDQMMRDQQELRDRTHRESQRGQNEEQNGDQSRSLQQRQEALRQQLEDLQRRMQQFGMKPPQGFKEAEEAMREAEGQLGKGDRPGQGRAAEAQGRALENLRQGMQSMAQQMQQQRGPGNQGGPGEPGGEQRRDAANPDPLGRESHRQGDGTRTPFDQPGATAAERAQRILEELRRRLSDPSRPSLELEYLERLLRRY